MPLPPRAVTISAVWVMVSGRFWAQEKKREASPGAVNYILESTQPPVSIEEMIKGMERGLVISRFWYVRQIDPRAIMLTGLTRDGLWWVEKGQIRYPVRNLRFNQSVLAMLAPWNVLAVGAPVRKAPLMVPALKLAGFTFTSMWAGQNARACVEMSAAVLTRHLGVVTSGRP